MQTRRPFLVSVAALVAGLTAATSAHAKPVLPAPAMAELERYDVLGYSDPHNNGVERGKAIGLFDATPDEVYRVATDYSRWGEFMPKIKRSEIVAFSGADCNVALTAELKFLGENWVEAKYHHQQHGDTYRVDFAMERGQLKQYLGSILVEPYRKADGSLKSTVTFEVVAEPNGFAPRSILNRAIKRIAVNSVHALRQRVNDLHAAGLLHPNQPAQPLQPIAAQPQRPQAKK